MSPEDTAVEFSQQELIALFADPAVRADPFPLYRRLQEADPVHKSFAGFWVVSRYDDVVSILRDPRMSSDERKLAAYKSDTSSEPGAFTQLFNRLLLVMDPPDHERIRGLVQKAFSRRVIERLRPRIEVLAGEALDTLEGQTQFDLLATFAYPVPTSVICELLGVPIEDHDRFHEWARDLAARMEIQPLRTPEIETRGDVAATELIAYFEELVAARRQAPGDDLLSELIAAEEDGDRLSPDELYATCVLLLMAGHETTANLVGNGLLALLRNPREWRRLIEHSSLLKPGVEELLRFAGPVQLTQRIALEELRIRDKTIAAGEGIALLIASANRDPDRFADPDRLDVGRLDNHHVALSAGIHFCLGAPLARLEAQIMLGAIIDRFPHLELAEEPVWRQTFVLRALESLPLSPGRRL